MLSEDILQEVENLSQVIDSYNNDDDLSGIELRTTALCENTKSVAYNEELTSKIESFKDKMQNLVTRLRTSQEEISDTVKKGANAVKWQTAYKKAKGFNM